MRYVIFLRGINVGNLRIKMVDLKETVEAEGYKNVHTILQSGNIVLESDKSSNYIKQNLENVISQRFNYDAKLQILSFEKLNNIINDYPFDEKPGFHKYVIFFENNLDLDALKDIQNLALEDEYLAHGDSVIYWQIEKGHTLTNDFAKLLNKTKYKKFNTNRNMNTIKRIVSLDSSET